MASRYQNLQQTHSNEFEYAQNTNNADQNSSGGMRSIGNIPQNISQHIPQNISQNMQQYPNSYYQLGQNSYPTNYASNPIAPNGEGEENQEHTQTHRSNEQSNNQNNDLASQNQDLGSNAHLSPSRMSSNTQNVYCGLNPNNNLNVEGNSNLNAAENGNLNNGMQNLQASGQSGAPGSVQGMNMQSINIPSLHQELAQLNGKIGMCVAQMQQIQMNLAAIQNTNNPQSAQVYQFLTARLLQLKNIYVQLTMGQQQIQRVLAGCGQNVQGMNIPQGAPQSANAGMPSGLPQGIAPGMPQGVPHNLPPVMVQNMPPQGGFNNQNLMYQQQMQMQMMQRNAMAQAHFQNRIPGNMPGMPGAMMPPALSRFQSPRGIPGMMPGMMTGMVPGMGGYMMQGQRPQFIDNRIGRRGPKQMRRKKHLSSESEEEEELTTSDADSVSQLSQSELQNDEGEVRRSTRRQTNRNYIQEFNDSESESRSKKENESVLTNQQDLLPFQPNENSDVKIMLIERVLADRITTIEPVEKPSVEVSADPDNSSTIEKQNLETKSNSDVSQTQIEEFLIKWKYYSYLHCEWCSLEELKKRDRNALSKVKRYKQRKRDVPFLYMDEEPFNPDYVEIDRILDIKRAAIDPVSKEQVNCYLIKWCALPYDESTWEFEEAVDKAAIDDYYRRNTYTPDLAVYKQRPNLYQWQKLSKSPVYKNDNVLREYQLEGINWLLYEYFVGTNCILADEMGLGKTIQSIAFLCEVHKFGIRGPFLVIAPLSTIGNWYREFQSWSDLNVIVFHGAAASRNIIHRYELHFRDEAGNVIPDVCKFEVLITTYEMILSENKFLSTVRWRIAIVDEAHRLKNRKCKLLDNLSNILIEHRVLLTGTPLQNTLDELLSLLNFLDPSRAEALENVIHQSSSGKLETNAQVQQIQSFLKPVILRRLKEDVEKNIAPKEETIIEVEMTSIQKKVYRGILERNLSFLTKGTSSSNLPNLMNVMMELRKCCNHPFLNNGVEEKIMAEFCAANPTMDRHKVYRKALIESSGKLVLVDKLLPKLRDSGHKMLIFSQMVRVLDLIEEYLVSHGFLFERIDGGVRGNLRQAAIDRFSKPDSDKCVFLLCTKAGGLGINLTAADTVIIFDSDWNPQNDIQAQARCHRIGQNKAVKVYRLICRKTYEREMFDRASLKLGLDKAVLQDINATNSDEKGRIPGKTQLTKKEVEELLRRGAYAAVMDEDTEASAKFCSEDIEQILERRATVIQVAGESKGSTFAKASFNAEISGDQVDIDDPDFWQKWAKSANVSATPATTDFIGDRPRIRKQVRSIEDDSEVDYTELTATNVSGRRSHSQQVLRTSWFKKECLKVEKQLLVFGWGRWNDIHQNGAFKSNMGPHDVEQISKTIIIIAWHCCKNNDASYTDFVEKAIRITTLKHRGEFDSEDFNYKPYGKRTRGKKARESRKKSDKQKPCLYQASSDWKSLDIDTLVFDQNYKKHLIHCASKILIRLRLLFYIEYYILRDCKADILAGVSVEDLKFPINDVSRTGLTLPEWWDERCDRSLIVGTFKHGYEKYPAFKTDPKLCFITHLNTSKSSEISEQVTKRRGRKKKIAIASDEDENNLSNVQESETNTQQSLTENGAKLSDMPLQTDLNTLIKRLVTAYWKSRSKSHQKSESKIVEPKGNKWTRKEETDFYKALTVFGVEYTSDGIIVWDGFRYHGKFDKKDDVMMSQYLDGLVRKCLTVINPQMQPIAHGANESLVSEGFVNIDKAEKVLKFIELFDLIRKVLLFVM